MNLLKIAMFFFVLLLVTAGVSAYLYFRMIHFFRVPWQVKLFFLLVVVFSFLTTPMVAILRHFGFENRFLDMTAWAGYSGLGVVAFVFCFMVVRDLVLALFHLGSNTMGFFLSRFGPEKGMDPERRRLIFGMVNSGILVSSLTLGGVGLYLGRRKPMVSTVVIPVPGLPEALNGFRIAQITDIHLSATLKGDWLLPVVEAVNALDPHIIALTGDLVDGTVDRLKNDVLPLTRLTPCLGKFFVTGNHEYYSGVSAWVKKMKTLGFDVLLNEHRVVEQDGAKVLVAGVTDFRGGDFSPEHISDPGKAMKGAPETDVKILLAHQPKSVFAAEKAGFDLQISGHTHAGQFFPWKWAVYLDQPYVEGLHRHGEMYIYVSRGTGYWGPPMRLGSPSEITLMVLRPQARS